MQWWLNFQPTILMIFIIATIRNRSFWTQTQQQRWTTIIWLPVTPRPFYGIWTSSMSLHLLPCVPELTTWIRRPLFWRPTWSKTGLNPASCGPWPMETCNLGTTTTLLLLLLTVRSWLAWFYTTSTLCCRLITHHSSSSSYLTLPCPFFLILSSFFIDIVHPSVMMVFLSSILPPPPISSSTYSTSTWRSCQSSSRHSRRFVSLSWSSDRGAIVQFDWMWWNDAGMEFGRIERDSSTRIMWQQELYHSTSRSCQCPRLVWTVRLVGHGLWQFASHGISDHGTQHQGRGRDG